MPRVNEFFGIIIAMYYNDHAPPHFHAIYGEHEAKLRNDTFEILEGYLPRRTLKLVREWAGLHRKELAANWNRARHGEPLKPIKPLQ